MLQVCLVTGSNKNKWYLDSSCSRHMTGDKIKLNNIKETDYGEVIFGDSGKDKVIGIRNVGNKHLTISDV